MDSSNTQLTINTRLWGVALLLTIAIGSLFYWYKDAIIPNIMAIQFSSTLEQFNTNISSALPNARLHTYINFVFIISYSLLFYAAYRVFQTSMRIPFSKLVIVICFLPGIFDLIENFLFLHLIDNLDSSKTFSWYWWMVRAKWTLVIPFFMMNITILIYYLVKSINSLVTFIDEKKK
ncbi:MAG: hypothetical protein ACSHW7_06420 [Patiriisocius sp.]|uniref:hypothetical protein n=1 Tax=Patiriisocius sp. TaxID=2822396 RepID=UPI003EF316B6